MNYQEGSGIALFHLRVHVSKGTFSLLWSEDDGAIFRLKGGQELNR